MKIGVIGSGYVGLVAAACFSEMGNTVYCIDIDYNKIQSLKDGIVPIYEPGLDSYVKKNYTKKRLFFSTDITNALSDAEVVFIAVGTPMGDDGSADLQYVLNVAKSIGQNMFHHIGEVTRVVGMFIVHSLKSLNNKNCIYGSIGSLKDNVGFGN